MSEERWYFTKEQLENSPSRRCGIDADKELSQRQQAANFIQDMGQRLQVTQLCINTAIVYMHRFYCFHSFTAFHRNAIASAALFLAAKVEEQPRKLEHIIKVAQMCLQKGQPPQPNPDRRSEVYLKEAQDLVQNENILLMTLGFDVAIEHPHAFIVKFCHIVNASKDLSQTSYFMASNSLHLTTMCLQYKPTVVACFCIHLVCKWSNWQIPKSKENLPWYSYIDQSVTEELLEQLTNEFLVIFDKCPSRLKKKIQNSQLSSQNPSMSSYPFDVDSRKPNSSSSHGQASSSSANAASFPLSKASDDQGQQHPSGHGKHLFSIEARSLSNVVPAAANHLTHHSPAVAKPAVTTVPSSVVNGTSTAALLSSSNAHDNNLPSKLPNLTNSVIPSQAARSSTNHTLPPPSSFSSHHPHKAAVSNTGNLANPPPPSHSNAAVKTRPAAVSGHSVLPKEAAPRIEQTRKLPEVKQEPSYVSAVTSSTVSNNHHVRSSSSSSAHKKDNGLPQEVRPSAGSFLTAASSSSHSEIISNVVKEVAKQNEKQRLISTVKTEPVDEDVKPSIADTLADVPKTHKSHSIFSPSPIGHNESVKSSPLEERSHEVVVKTEPHYDVARRRNRSLSSSSGEPELIPIVKKVETVAGYEDIFTKSVVSIPSASLLSPKIEFKEKKNNVAPTIAPNVSMKEEPADSYDYQKSCTASQQPDEHPALDRTTTDSGECTSHSHKKKKKHKEKDKRHDKEKHRHKEKKRHKEEKHRKEHKERDSLKEPGPISPIKITIPRELITPETLVDIPPAKNEKDGSVRLKIKLSKDQIASSVTEESVVVATTAPAPEFKLKISKDKLKSRKRNRESTDHEEVSKKFAYNGPDSHNGY